MTPALISRAAAAYERDRGAGLSPFAAMRSAMALVEASGPREPISHGVPVYVEAVMAAAAKANGLTLDDIRAFNRRKGRTTNRCGRVRGEAVYVARALSDVSYQEMGRYFGGRSHSAMRSAREAFAERLKVDDVLRARIERIVGAKREEQVAA